MFKLIRKNYRKDRSKISKHHQTSFDLDVDISIVAYESASWTINVICRKRIEKGLTIDVHCAHTVDTNTCVLGEFEIKGQQYLLPSIRCRRMAWLFGHMIGNDSI